MEAILYAERLRNVNEGRNVREWWKQLGESEDGHPRQVVAYKLLYSVRG